LVICSPPWSVGSGPFNFTLLSPISDLLPYG
jgi:hypothetical protein